MRCWFLLTDIGLIIFFQYCYIFIPTRNMHDTHFPVLIFAAQVKTCTFDRPGPSSSGEYTTARKSSITSKIGYTVYRLLVAVCKPVLNNLVFATTVYAHRARRAQLLWGALPFFGFFG